MTDALLRKIDCHLLRASDLDAAIEFYHRRLGQKLLWKSDVAAGFEMPDTDAELVVHTALRPETDLLVKSVPEAFARLIAAGASCVREPFDVPIGKCAVVKDPFGNRITILDQSKGLLQTDENKNVVSEKGP